MTNPEPDGALALACLLVVVTTAAGAVGAADDPCPFVPFALAGVGSFAAWLGSTEILARFSTRWKRRR